MTLPKRSPAGIRQRLSLAGRTALVTGGSGHLGAVIAHGLAEVGANVALVDLDAAGASRIAGELADAYGTRAVGLGADLENAEAVRALPARVVQDFGAMHILVNCAALVGSSALRGWATPFAEQGADAWRRALDVNLTAPFVLAQASAEPLAASGHGTIVNIGSIYGVVGPDWRLYEGTAMASPAAYAASKGGLLQLTQWLATTLAPAIRVNAVSPGGIMRGHTDPFLSRYVARTPLGRMGREDDVVGAVVFLASDLAAYITGQNILVDGGWTAW